MGRSVWRAWSPDPAFEFLAVVAVEHGMSFVRSIARLITVRHRGNVLAEGTMEQVSNARQ